MLEEVQVTTQRFISLLKWVGDPEGETNSLYLTPDKQSPSVLSNVYR